MHKRWIAAVAVFLVSASSAGCEITASAYIQHDLNSNPRVFDKPDGLVKAEIKVTRLIGRDAKR
jgi:hypothetical protein